ncbi:hypothetical protein ScPMuIL_007160 [Solemya velum]
MGVIVFCGHLNINNLRVVSDENCDTLASERGLNCESFRLISYWLKRFNFELPETKQEYVAYGSPKVMSSEASQWRSAEYQLQTQYTCVFASMEVPEVR